MHERIVEFIAALRGAGVRVSLAESIDALRAVEQAGLAERAWFRAALQATLIKAPADRPAFARLFPLFFGGAAPPLAADDRSLSPAAAAALAQARAAMGAQIDQPGLAQLFDAALLGQPMGQAQLLALLPRPAPSGLSLPRLQRWAARQAVRALPLDRLDELLGRLLDQLRGAGLPEADLAAVAQRARANRAALAEQAERAALGQIQRQAEQARPRLRPPDELLDQPMYLLSTAEAEELRAAVARLAAQLRTRVSLRQRRDRRGALNMHGTLRAGLRYGGLPFELRRRRRRLQPRLLVLCDVSSSMRAAATMMLLLVAALHDQIRHTRAFAYIDAIYDIGADFRSAQPARAVAAVLGRIPAAYVSTDLGGCLDQLLRQEPGAVDRRTTVLILGDGRNNGADPGLGALRQIKARAHRLIWLTPEPRRAWGSGDSDLLAYAPLCDEIRVVQTLRQLSDAVGAALTA